MQLPTENFGVITYKEMKGSPQESYAGRQGKVRRRFLVNWGDRWPFAQTMIGYSYVPPFAAGEQYIKRIPPQGYPAVRPLDSYGAFDEYWLYATDIDSIEGLNPSPEHFPMGTGDDTPLDQAVVTVSYEAITFKALSDQTMRDKGFTHDGTLTGRPLDFYNGKPRRYITKVSQPTAEYLKTPFGAFFFKKDQATGTPPIGWVPASLGQGRIISSKEIIYVWHQFPTYLSSISDDSSRVYYPAAVDTHLGTVNDATFDGYNKGTLLLLSFEYKPYRNIGGYLCGDVTYKMKHYEPKAASATEVLSGHNFFLKPDFPQSSPILRVPLQWRLAASKFGGTDANPTYPDTSTDDVYMYNYRDFKKLFSIAP